nr:MAG TPA: hypothetical protein [Caudoviricetes sp.]
MNTGVGYILGLWVLGCLSISAELLMLYHLT